MNVTVSILSHFSVDYDIQVMAVLLEDTSGFYQTMRLQCKDLSEETTDRTRLIRWSCLPLNCDSKTVFLSRTRLFWKSEGPREKMQPIQVLPKIGCAQRMEERSR